MARARCHVTFITGRGGPAAILWDRHGHALNARNYPRGHKFTAAEKARARKDLMRGCAEFAREYESTGNVSTKTMAKHRGLFGRARGRKRRK